MYHSIYSTSARCVLTPNGPLDFASQRQNRPDGCTHLHVTPHISGLNKIQCLLTTWSRVLHEKLYGFQLIKKFPKFYGTRRFIPAFASARHLSLSWACSIQSITPHPTSWRSILIFSPINAWVFQVVSFPQVSPPKPCIHLSPTRATCPAHLIILDFITRTKLGEEYRSWSSSLCSFHHSPVTSSLLDPNILLNTVFSNTLRLRFFLNVTDQVSHPYKNRENYSSVYLDL